MWAPGTFLRLGRETGAFVRPHRRAFDQAQLCLVISGTQRSFGTKGATNEYLMLVGSTLLTIVIDDDAEMSWRVEVLKEA